MGERLEQLEPRGGVGADVGWNVLRERLVSRAEE